MFPVLWMLGNYRVHGDPTMPLDYINGEHRQWAATLRRILARAVAPCSRCRLLASHGAGLADTGVAVLGFIGTMSVWRERRSVRWLIVALSAPILLLRPANDGPRRFRSADAVHGRFARPGCCCSFWDGYLTARPVVGTGCERTQSSGRPPSWLSRCPSRPAWSRSGAMAPFQMSMRPISPRRRILVRSWPPRRSSGRPSCRPAAALSWTSTNGYLDFPLVLLRRMLEEQADPHSSTRGHLPRRARSVPATSFGSSGPLVRLRGLRLGWTGAGTWRDDLRRD